MVESQLRTSDVDDPRVIAVMARVPREDFVPAQRRAMAYVDRPIPLGSGRALNPPLVTGRLLKEAQVEAGDKVLLIGAATGYAAALLTGLGATVTAVEEEGVADIAAPGVSLVRGPLNAGAPAGVGVPGRWSLISGSLVRLVPEAVMSSRSSAWAGVEVKYGPRFAERELASFARYSCPMLEVTYSPSKQEQSRPLRAQPVAAASSRIAARRSSRS